MKKPTTFYPKHCPQKANEFGFLALFVDLAIISSDRAKPCPTCSPFSSDSEQATSAKKEVYSRETLLHDASGNMSQEG